MSVRDRVERAVRLIAESAVDALWVEPSPNFAYLFGFESLSLERLCGVLVPASGELRAVVPQMHAEEFEALGDVEQFTWSDTEGPDDAAAACLKGIRSLLVAPDLPARALFELRATSGAEIELDTSVLQSLRLRKDDSEVEELRRAAAATDGVVEWIGSQIADSDTESQLAVRIRAHYLELGHPEVIVLVASGPNAAMAHHLGDEGPIDPKRPLMIDIGARVGSYWSDTTRVFFAGEDPAVDQAYEVVLAAYEAAFAAVAPGVPCQEIDRAARGVIDESGYGEYFIHRTGHGLGLDVHEPPYLRSGNPTPLEVGNVFTIEPGIYLPGQFGLRYENTVYLGIDGPEALNKTPRMHNLR